MADAFRYRSGDSHPVMAAVDSSTVIALGDLLYYDTDDAKPAASQADQLTEEKNQRLFARNFFGVAAQRSRSGDTDPLRVDTDGVFEFACGSATWEVGDLAGAVEASGTQLSNTNVVKVYDPQLAIGVCVERVAVAETAVKIRLLSRRTQLAAVSPLHGQTSAAQTLSGALTLTLADARIQVLDPGGAGRDVTLPAEATSRGELYVIHNAADAAEVLTIKENGGVTICTPAQNETAIVYCDGTTWRGLVGANN